VARTNQKKQNQLELALTGKSGQSAPRSLQKGRTSKEYGGEDHGTKYRKNEKRPFDPEKSLHITMRSKYAHGESSMLHPKRAKHIKQIVYRAGRRHFVEIKNFVNVGNHLHLHIQTKSRKTFIARKSLAAFLREVGGLTARLVTGAKKGQPSQLKITTEITQTAATSLDKGAQVRCRPGRPPSPHGHQQRRKFWDNLVWSRIITSWSEIKTLTKYFQKNTEDALFVVTENLWPEYCLDFGLP
jgi:hypothetical protein